MHRWRLSTLRRLSTATFFDGLKRHPDFACIHFDDEHRPIVRLNVRSRAVLLTKATGAKIGNDTMTLVLPPGALEFSNTKYYVVIDEGALLYGERKLGTRLRPVEKIIRHFGTNGSQASWDRLGEAPLELRSLVMKQRSWARVRGKKSLNR